MCIRLKGIIKSKQTIMNIRAQKLELVELILGINNAKALKQLKVTIKEVTEAAVPETSSATKKKYKDDTKYMLIPQANRNHLMKSIAELDRGEDKAIKLEDLWK